MWGTDAPPMNTNPTTGPPMPIKRDSEPTSCSNKDARQPL